MEIETQSDEYEEDIWNYKAKVQLNKQTIKESSSGNTPLTLRTKSCGKQSVLNHKNKSKKQPVPENEKRAAALPSSRVRNNKAAIAVDVIDVDLEPENEFVSSKLPAARNGKKLGFEITQNNSTKNKTDTCVNSGIGMKKTKTKGRLSSSKKCSPAKMVTTTKVGVNSPRSKIDRVSSSQDSSRSLNCQNILTYFSPSSKTRKKKKRKSSESVDSLFDFTDDELLFVSEVQTEHTSPAGVTVSSKALGINNSHRRGCDKQTESSSEIEMTADPLLQINSSQSNLCADTNDVTKRETNERSTLKGDVTLDLKSVASLAWSSPGTNLKIFEEVGSNQKIVEEVGSNQKILEEVGSNQKIVEEVGSNQKIVIHDEIVNPAASLENKILAAKLDPSLEECDVSKPNTPEGGFLVNKHECGLDSNIEGGFLVNKHECGLDSNIEGGFLVNKHECGLDSNIEGGFLVNKHECGLDSDIEGGFLVNKHECELDSSIEGDKPESECELHMSSSSSESADCSLSPGIAQCDTPLAPRNAITSDKSNSFLNTSPDGALAAEKRHYAAKPSSVQNSPSSSANKCLLTTTAQKQTSIFSFFKAKYGSGSKTTTKSTNNGISVGPNLPPATVSNSILRVTARPNLHRGKTPSTTKYSVNEKSASVLAVSKQDGEETKEPPQSNARNKRQCPFYKKIPSTGITVDAFSYGVIPGCEAYVLTHFHYDHYGGLTKRFAQPIYCSQVTGNLVEQRLGVDKKWINHLPLWKPCQVAGVTLTLMEANHCPGAVMILFELKDGRKIVHTGDFRASPEMEEYPMLKAVVISDLYLDTTYCSPSYTFPTQIEVINVAVSLALDSVQRNPNTLVVCGTYTIGKEKIFAAIARALDSKICVTRDKKKVLDCLEDRDLRSRLTLDWSQGQVHVLPMGKLNQKALFEHLACHRQFQNVLVFEPTGWTYSGKTSLDNISPKWSRNGVTHYGLPYSEHSSYLELKRFIQFLRPKRILPTVNNGNPAARQKMEETFAQWMREPSHAHTTSSNVSQQRKMSAWLS